ncbi:RND family efflux transporter MFP subunit [Paraburkholderia sp. BL8N3]|nr:efflux RND transporter periplasmic adaptor subunit [Paraburkholderia sp. BL8N3]TCK35336.1 RND family efflux transporter MFP subunit [Paraburkholderia sp. BL8N3]
MSPARRATPSLLAAALVLALSGCSPDRQVDPRTEAALVRLATVNSFDQGSRSFTGVVVARVESDLGFRVAGKIVERLVDAGQAVKRGQPLMRIDATDLTLATRARDEAVAAAQARVQQTAADEKRYRELVGAGAVSASAYDQAKAAAETARADLRATEAQANVARNEAGYALLVADADGVVMDTLVEPGQVVAAGQTVVRIARSGPREARVDLPETLRPMIGSRASATLYGAGATTGEAVLRQLSDTADRQTRTYEARYVLQGRAAAAPLGATVTIALPDAGADPTVSVPLAAIYDKGQGPGVWLIAGAPAKVTWHAVQVQRISEEKATISAGLKPLDRFVALGAHMLHEGQVVRVVGAAGGTE